MLAGHAVEEALASRAAEAALAHAVPLSKNRYKIPMVKAAIRRVLTTLARA